MTNANVQQIVTDDAAEIGLELAPTDEFKKYFYGLLLICERGTTGLGHIN
jgi:hypothetical protein